jgi:A/G-specific adenine glycosylase
VLVSEFMLQQTPVTRDPHRSLAGAVADTRLWPPPPVAQWANLGYPRRALWLHRAAVEIRDRHDGVVPREVEASRPDRDRRLHGAGRGRVRLRRASPVVDTNTRRVIARAVDALSRDRRLAVIWRR